LEYFSNVMTNRAELFINLLQVNLLLIIVEYTMNLKLIIA
jgi:hypothetical protein